MNFCFEENIIIYNILEKLFYRDGLPMCIGPMIFQFESPNVPIYKIAQCPTSIQSYCHVVLRPIWSFFTNHMNG